MRLTQDVEGLVFALQGIVLPIPNHLPQLALAGRFLLQNLEGREGGGFNLQVSVYIRLLEDHGSGQS